MNKKTILIIAAIAGGLLFICCVCSIVIFVILPATSQSSDKTPSTPTAIPSVSDSFNDNQSNWAIGEQTNQYGIVSRSINGGKYVWSIENLTDEDILSFATPASLNYRNFVASVDGKKVSGDDTTNYNLLFRYINEKSFYTMKINSDFQMYNIGKLVNGVYTDIVKWKQDANITYKGLNNIKVEGVEDHFKCYVNNKLIFEFDDSDLSVGGAGLSVQLYDKNTKGEWEFDNFNYRSL